MTYKTKAILSYWNEILKLSALEEVEIEKDALRLQLEDVAQGQIVPANAKQLIHSAQQNKNSKSDAAYDVNKTSIPVLLCVRPFHVNRAQHSLLYIPAVLDSDGLLTPPDKNNGLPWIKREFLDPWKDDNSFTLGTLSDFDRSIAHMIRSPDQTWSDYLQECYKIFEDVSEWHITEYVLNQKTVREEECFASIQSWNGVVNAASGIQSVYSYLIENDKDTPVLERLVQGGQAENAKLPYSVKMQLPHTGHMNKDFGLNLSQRQSVVYSLSAKPSSIVAVNGPPGTGKTTLLKSTIASLWVNAALEGRDAMPPIIVGASTNNKAVTNILNTFATNTGSEIWETRWLPAPITQYGLYFPSQTKLKEEATALYQYIAGRPGKITQPPYRGWTTDIENEQFVEKAEKHYIANASSYLNQSAHGSVQSCVDQVYKKLQKLHQSYQDAMNRSDSLQKDVSEEIDKTYRYQLFHHAARYWEGRWLLEMRQLFKDKEPLSGQGYDITLRRFQRWAMLAPCFISTLHRAPHVFSYYRDDARQPLLNSIDLLIVDEAGQIAPEIGAATFALAKKALVVGDVFQIEPVASLGIEQDAIEAKRSKLDLETLEKSGLSSSTGNIMTLANEATTVTLPFAQKKGLMLREHRRCKDIIIDYCNKLVYKNELEPKTKNGNIGNGVTPMWGYAHTINTPQSVGSSYKNVKEAEIIARWISDHKNDLLKAYPGKVIADIVAVITPYAAQARTLQKALRNFLNAQDVKALTIGTVHALQGAEKPIVIFSPTVVYKENVIPFFDRTPNMLNVAVSRAQDSFLVFGDMRLFNKVKTDDKDKNEPDTKTKTPASLLGEFLMQSPENEIPDIFGFEYKGGHDLSVADRFTQHAQHEDLLINALENATFRVLIASPYLSIIRIDERLEKALRSAKARRVRVAVIYNEDLNLQGSKAKQNYLSALEKLKDCGCVLKAHPRFHNKTLAVDNDKLIDGSYNWLSAVSNPESPFHNREVSQRYVGNDIADIIDREWEEYDLGPMQMNKIDYFE